MKMSSQFCSRMRAQKGAVITEVVLVTGIVLISVLGLTSLMGKMIDTKHKVELASRYSAWERTVWFDRVPKYHPNKNLRKTRAQLQTELHHRVFSGPKSIVMSEQHLTLNGFEVDPMQKFHNRNKWSRNNYEPMYVSQFQVGNKPGYVQLTQTHASPPGKLANLVGVVTKPLDLIGDFKVNRKGYYTGEVGVQIHEFGWLKEFKNIKPILSSKSAILTDGWNAGGVSDAEGRVRGLLPLSLLEGKVGDVIQDFVGFLFKPLRSDSLEFGKVASDPVPEHRLKRYPNR